MSYELEGLIHGCNGEARSCRLEGQAVVAVVTPEPLGTGTRMKILDRVPYPVRFIVGIKLSTVAVLGSMAKSIGYEYELKSNERDVCVDYRCPKTQVVPPELKIRLGMETSSLLKRDGFAQKTTIKIDGLVIHKD